MVYLERGRDELGELLLDLDTQGQVAQNVSATHLSGTKDRWQTWLMASSPRLRTPAGPVSADLTAAVSSADTGPPRLGAAWAWAPISMGAW